MTDSVHPDRPSDSVGSAACCCHLSPEEWRRCPLPEHDHTKWTEHGWNCPASCGHPMAVFAREASAIHGGSDVCR